MKLATFECEWRLLAIASNRGRHYIRMHHGGAPSPVVTMPGVKVTGRCQFNRCIRFLLLTRSSPSRVPWDRGTGGMVR